LQPAPVIIEPQFIAVDEPIIQNPTDAKPAQIVLTLNSESNADEILGEDNFNIEGLPSPE
jgi:hypothetical protein